MGGVELELAPMFLELGLCGDKVILTSKTKLRKKSEHIKQEQLTIKQQSISTDSSNLLLIELFVNTTTNKRIK
jgi:hypothetical protein